MTNLSDDSYVDRNLAKKVYFTFLIFSFLWVLLIFIAPLLADSGGIYSKMSDFIYIFFSKVCHQESNRSFHFSDHILGVCSRCVWIYIGFFAGILVYPLKYRLNNTNSPNLMFLIAVSFILFLDVILDLTGILKNSFLSRSITGFLTGLMLPFYLLPGFVKFFHEINSFLRNKMSYKN
ncbi:MAG TPA: DUF2085 domain-containing protein [Ignavibacteria bacterium]|nr:DUF2085 domain-containing protein [Ignavibacteria bacterium]